MPTSAELLALACEKHRSGDLSGAAELYRRLLEQEPTNADALGLCGLVHQQQGEIAKAEWCYRQALGIRPVDPETHFNLGTTLQFLGRPAEAVQHLREAIRLRPNFVEAWNNLGGIHLKQHDYEGAIACFREAVRLRPEYAEACVNLGNALRENDEVVEGLKWYQEAVRLKPAYPKAHNNLAVSLLELGKPREAETHLREALRYTPGSIQVLWNLAANGLYSESDPGVAELQARLADSRLSLHETGQLHFLIAWLLDRAGAYDQAFPHLREGNRLRREQLQREGNAFDPASHRRLIDRLIATFTSAFFDRVKQFGLETELPVFIVGMPRSGSSLVEQVLSHHPEAGGAGELRDFPRLVDDLPSRCGGEPFPECVHRLDQPMTRVLAESYLERLKRVVGPARRAADKMLENFLYLGLIAVLFPRARVIHCRRDPMDVCFSCYRQFFMGLNFTWDLGDLGEYYRDYERLMAHWRAVLPLPMLDVGYEELVADLEGVSRRMLAFCGLEWDERCLRFHENRRPVRTVSKLQVRVPVYGSSIGGWRRYAEHLGALREALGI